MTGPFAGVPPAATLLPHEAAESYCPGGSPDAYTGIGSLLTSIARSGELCGYRTWSERMTT